MKNLILDSGRVLLGVLGLFVSWAIGGYLGTVISPHSTLVGGRESLSGKIGCSLGVLMVSIIIRRYLLHSKALAVCCIGMTEVIVSVVIVLFMGSAPLRLSTFQFVGWWLYALTWNVVLAFLVGTTLGWFWEQQSVQIAEPSSNAFEEQ